MNVGAKRIGIALLVGTIAVTGFVTAPNLARADEAAFQQALQQYNQAIQNLQWAKAKYEAAKLMARNNRKGWGALVGGANLVATEADLANAQRDLEIASQQLDYAKTH